MFYEPRERTAKASQTIAPDLILDSYTSLFYSEDLSERVANERAKVSGTWVLTTNFSIEERLPLQ
jgi:hypothetical protein